MVDYLKNINKYSTLIEDFWQKREIIIKNQKEISELKKILAEIINLLNLGKIRVSEKDKTNGEWFTNEWIKKSILLYFKFTDSKSYITKYAKWRDKIPAKFSSIDDLEFNNITGRIVPGSFIRTGSYIGENTIIMPSFINIGAHIGDGTMIDTWSTIGSCAQIGKNCHISGGVGIGGVLEPLQSRPVIIEDNCFIGARSEVAEGVIIEEGSVLSMGVFIAGSTKIINRNTGEIIYGKVPRYSVVVPGSIPNENNKLPSLYCAVIIKQVDEKTRSKTEINELLRF